MHNQAWNQTIKYTLCIALYTDSTLMMLTAFQHLCQAFHILFLWSEEQGLTIFQSFLCREFSNKWDMLSLKESYCIIFGLNNNLKIKVESFLRQTGGSQGGHGFGLIKVWLSSICCEIRVESWNLLEHSD